MSLGWLTNGDTAVDRATYVAAVASATNLAWMPQLQTGLSIVLTVMGIAWLAMQMWFKWRDRNGPPK